MNLVPSGLQSNNQEYLITAFEFLSEWFNFLYRTHLTKGNFFRNIQNGVLLCQHCNHIYRLAQQNSVSDTALLVPDEPILYNPRVHFGFKFGAEENINLFLSWCRNEMRLKYAFSLDDIIGKIHNGRIALCLLELNAKASLFGLNIPDISNESQIMNDILDFMHHVQFTSSVNHSANYQDKYITNQEIKAFLKNNEETVKRSRKHIVPFIRNESNGIIHRPNSQFPSNTDFQNKKNVISKKHHVVHSKYVEEIGTSSLDSGISVIHSSSGDSKLADTDDVDHGWKRHNILFEVNKCRQDFLASNFEEETLTKQKSLVVGRCTGVSVLELSDISSEEFSKERANPSDSFLNDSVTTTSGTYIIDEEESNDASEINERPIIKDLISKFESFSCPTAGNMPTRINKFKLNETTELNDSLTSSERSEERTPYNSQNRESQMNRSYIITSNVDNAVSYLPNIDAMDCKDSSQVDSLEDDGCPSELSMKSNAENSLENDFKLDLSKKTKNVIPIGRTLNRSPTTVPKVESNHSKGYLDKSCENYKSFEKDLKTPQSQTEHEAMRLLASTPRIEQTSRENNVCPQEHTVTVEKEKNNSIVVKIENLKIDISGSNSSENEILELINDSVKNSIEQKIANLQKHSDANDCCSASKQKRVSELKENSSIRASNEFIANYRTAKEEKLNNQRKSHDGTLNLFKQSECEGMNDVNCINEPLHRSVHSKRNISRNQSRPAISGIGGISTAVADMNFSKSLRSFSPNQPKRPKTPDAKRNAPDAVKDVKKKIVKSRSTTPDPRRQNAKTNSEIKTTAVSKTISKKTPREIKRVSEEKKCDIKTPRITNRKLSPAPRKDRSRSRTPTRIPRPASQTRICSEPNDRVAII